MQKSWEKERQLNVPDLQSECCNQRLPRPASIQKISLNLGLDEYKYVIPGIKATATSLDAT